MQDLRISVTDRCNLRCTYCMPREVFDSNHAFLPRSELLNFEEIHRLARLFVGLGVKKIRLTGGEPLLRRNLEQLVEMLAKIQTPEGDPVEVTLTTNGVLLAKQAQSLKDAGLARISISLDGLSDETFKRMSDSDVPVGTVLKGIEAAQQAGFASTKVNMVVQRGVNDHEILPMAEYFMANRGIILRYIEYMDVGSTNGWRMDEVVTAQEIIELVSRRHALERIEPNYAGEVAERWRYGNDKGEIGVIASITRPFCQSCTRARLATDGKFYTCLFANSGLDLRDPLRRNVSDQILNTLIEDRWQHRADRYSQLRSAIAEFNNPLFGKQNSDKKIEMSYIGG